MQRYSWKGRSRSGGVTAGGRAGRRKGFPLKPPYNGCVMGNRQLYCGHGECAEAPRCAADNLGHPGNFLQRESMVLQCVL
jgi:hypothetical protein